MSHLNILFLKNIFLKNFEQPEDLMEKKILEDLLPNNSINGPCVVEGIDDGHVSNGNNRAAADDPTLLDSMSDVLLGDMPLKFTNLKNWPTRSNLLCWYCSLKSTMTPVSIPVAMSTYKNNENISKVEMKTIGIFCSFPCAKSWLDLNYPKNEISSGWADKNNFLRLFFKEIHKFEPLSILPAPSPYCMSKFCGQNGISEDQYRKKIQEINAAILTLDNSRR